MTNKQANEYFKTKYPEGIIETPAKSSAPKGSYFVVFEPLGKVYYYRAQNYHELLGKLKIKGFEKYA